MFVEGESFFRTIKRVSAPKNIKGNPATRDTVLLVNPEGLVDLELPVPIDHDFGFGMRVKVTARVDIDDRSGGSMTTFEIKKAPPTNSG